MESLYLLIPLSLLLVLGIGVLLAWSVLGGQFDDLDAEGRRILADDPGAQPTRDTGATTEPTTAFKPDRD
jgi:cbb3-type cytochrome oxidase maturation protein